MATATIGITTTFAILTTAVAVCATNTERRGLRIENGSNTASMYFGFGTNNAATTAMHALATASAITFGPTQPEFRGIVSQPANVPAGDLSVIALTTTGTLVVTEW